MALRLLADPLALWLVLALAIALALALLRALALALPLALFMCLPLFWCCRKRPYGPPEEPKSTPERA